MLDGSIQLSSVGPAAPAVVFPINTPVSFDPGTSKIYFTGVMSDAQKLALLTTTGPAGRAGRPELYSGDQRAL